MKTAIFILLFIGVFLPVQSQEEVVGRWENTNEDGKVNSIIKIYEKNGEIYGKVDRIMKEEDRNRVCTKCEGELKNVPIEGMELMKGFKKDGDEFVGGTIVDPKNGKEYRSKIWLDEDNPDLLKIRGYISFFYRTKTWRRAE
ncbi:DUF2147 domain-containing protein [Christiangramia forsetii]|uniref:DUF2147 domain-containing protein n=2 Tax=Christiangramia forsetii TaxID=411153 RepID=A0M0D4_CHRFK|nr:DUF2147 domain-containing protein [Christiangramia forsetii]GGG41171.1 hypothetical protein GCM10011532_26140 [Christiangramia forsetii]CAL66079.1 conserved hypothetical protein, secreted [Christiangramia forsetii KT0803]